MGRAIFSDLKILKLLLHFSENMSLYDQTKMTKLEHTTTEQKSITSKNSHKKMVAPFLLKRH